MYLIPFYIFFLALAAYCMLRSGAKRKCRVCVRKGAILQLLGKMELPMMTDPSTENQWGKLGNTQTTDEWNQIISLPLQKLGLRGLRSQGKRIPGELSHCFQDIYLCQVHCQRLTVAERQWEFGPDLRLLESQNGVQDSEGSG